MPNPMPETPSQDEIIQDLQAWISKAVAKIEDKLARRKKKQRPQDAEDEFPPLALSWVDPEGQEKPVHHYDREDLEGLGSPIQIAQAIYARAAQDASSMGDRQAYFVTIEGFPGRFPLVFDDSEEGEDFDEEGPDAPDEGFGGGRGEERGMSRYGDGGGMSPPGFGAPGGARVPIYDYVEWGKLRSQHEQMLMKENRQLVSEFMRASRTIIQELTETVRSQDKQAVSVRIALEEMLDAKHRRDLETRQLTQAEERKERAIQMIEPFAKSIAMRMLGPAALQGENGQTLYGLLNSVFSTFSEEQLHGIVGTGQVKLTAMQQSHIIELFKMMKSMETQSTPQNGVNGSHGTPSQHQTRMDGGVPSEERNER